MSARRNTTRRRPLLRLATLETREHLQLTTTDVIAWYRLAPQPWQWRGADYCNEHLHAAATAWAGLAGRTVHVRVLPRPYPTHRWAAALSRITPEPANRTAFKGLLRDTQRHLRASSHTESETYIGVRVTDRGAVDKLHTALTRGRSGARERARITREVTDVDTTVAGAGLAGRPVTTAELDWLIDQSIGLFLPERVDDDPDAADGTADRYQGLQDSVDVDPRPGQRSVTITATPHRNGNPVTRHVGIARIARMEDLRIPEAHDPWMAIAERLPFPVQWSARLEVRTGATVVPEVVSKLNLVADQVEQLDKHGFDIPPKLERLRARATEQRDRLEEQHEDTTVSYQGYWDIAVAGRDDTEVRDRLRAVRQLYRQMRITVNDKMGAQHELYRGFIPGEPMRVHTHTRHGGADYLAGAVPQLASRIGDLRGPYMGWTNSTSRRAFCWDPHYGIEVRERSGLTPVIGGLGAGKSALVGAVAYWSAIRGISTTILDPAGPLAKLCTMPELAPISRHVDLMQSPAGTLSPYTVIPDPTVEHAATSEAMRGTAPGDPDYDDRVAAVHADMVDLAARQRTQLATDVLLGILPPVFATEKRARVIIGDAVRDVGGKRTASLGSVMDRIRADPRDVDHELANVLGDISAAPAARLFFGSGYMAEADAGTDEPTLLVLTMPDLALPDEDTPEHRWPESKRIAVKLLELAAHYATRRIYSRPRRERKLVSLDEAHQLRRVATGRELVDRLARQSRAWTARILLATQKCSDLEDLATSGLIREMFGGRMEDTREAEAFLRMLRAPVGVGYEERLTGLSPDDATSDDSTGYREFVVRDVDGNTERVRIDLTHLPDLLDVLRADRNTYAPTEPVPDPEQART